MSTKYDDIYGGKYLKAADLPDEDLTVTITGAKVEAIGPDKEEKCLLTLREIPDKKLVVNKTNASTIAALFGKDFEEWIGKKITLFSTEVDFAGKSTLAIRVRTRAPKAAQKQPEPAFEEPPY